MVVVWGSLFTNICILFHQYKFLEELEVGIKSSRYFSGTLRCRKDSRDQAYVSGGGQLGKDILIIGNENRNRAGKYHFHGTVAIINNALTVNIYVQFMEMLWL